MALIRRGWQNPRPAPALPPGHRVFVIGDAHGRLDLVSSLVDELRRYDRGCAPARTILLFLGDVIDRGPSSAALVAMLAAGVDWAGLVCLKGNHEAAMMAALAGDRGASQLWLRHGGLQSLESWGVAPGLLASGERDAIIEAARRTIPAEHLRWLGRLPISLRLGDYLFVHAGIRPGIPLDRQSAADQLWIRKAFLESTADHGACVVHGHTVTEEVEEHDNRIGIDTGAYASDRLSALVLEDDRRSYVASVGGAIDWTPPVRREPA